LWIDKYQKPAPNRHHSTHNSYQSLSPTVLVC
jgi:hypothetical protein